MNVESYNKLPKRLLEKQYTLATVCHVLTLKLSNRGWLRDDVRNIEFGRSITDRVGDAMDVDESESFQTYNTTRVDFYADKIPVRDEDNNALDLIRYKLVMAVRQTIEKDEMEPYIIDKIFDAIEEADEDEEEYDVIFDGITRDDLDDIDIEREIRLEYAIDQAGGIDGYELSHNYYFNGTAVHESVYDTIHQAYRPPIMLAGTYEVVDRKPLIDTPLTEESLPHEIEDIDVTWLNFVQELRLEEMLELGGQDQLAHRRQALSIIALLSSGMYTMRQLLG